MNKKWFVFTKQGAIHPQPTWPHTVHLWIISVNSKVPCTYSVGVAVPQCTDGTPSLSRYGRCRLAAVTPSKLKVTYTYKNKSEQVSLYQQLHPLYGLNYYHTFYDLDKVSAIKFSGSLIWTIFRSYSCNTEAHLSSLMLWFFILTINGNGLWSV